ncbi:hypothetical protein VOLCADRAFT_83434 [Volvox carteri f. nagariensis]|uniref:Uncharacterized protein n=1 Tax=Volvox carteri f. nagariensis TaxID=3068 RepID=D8UBB7_VOLCA|nr:uncharacterized protein VOLCADRAFT_83434 [Volvox carteri f. nagariensis]EFJ42976.1 hypothetical protein VOLCADRAFT_83434 [Volvox carteri f. nagariensis]|eukprot:XP_002956016.1 hypothetical protein VOLCADRAFT_83434 [Volvox carteri f. nagariensis]
MQHTLRPCSLRNHHPFHSLTGVRCRKLTHHCRAGPDSAFGEDVLARLKAAEEEAARLRKELAAAQAAKQGGQDPVEKEGKPVRIDSVDNRETLFGGGPRTTWLSEKDVEFFSGPAGVREEDASTEAPEYKATVQRRLLIGGVLTLGLGAFALIPTEALRPKPSKPMYFYLVPLLRIQELLVDCRAIIEDADWDQLRQALSRIEGPPNNVRQNLDNIIALIPEAKTATRVQELSADLYEYLRSLDYQQYFDAIPQKAISGAQNAQYAQFSLSALKAAQGKLGELLLLVPRDQLDLARDQLAVGY